MKKSRHEPVTPEENRAFTLKVLLLLVAIALVAWAGWYIPRNIRSSVQVQPVDLRRPKATPQAPDGPPKETSGSPAAQTRSHQRARPPSAPA